MNPTLRERLIGWLTNVNVFTLLGRRNVAASVKAGADSRVRVEQEMHAVLRRGLFRQDAVKA